MSSREISRLEQENAGDGIEDLKKEKQVEIIGKVNKRMNGLGNIDWFPNSIMATWG